MKYSEAYYSTYQQLPEKLASQYSDLPFDNHCYLRIGLDHVMGAKWDTKLKRPAYKNLSETQRQELLRLLAHYQIDKELLLRHNGESLAFRGKR